MIHYTVFKFSHISTLYGHEVSVKQITINILNHTWTIQSSNSDYWDDNSMNGVNPKNKFFQLILSRI